MIKKHFSLGLLILAPLIAFAQVSTLDDMLFSFTNLLDVLIKYMAPLAFAFFMYHMIMFIKDSNAGSATLGKSKDMMIYSGIILFVMFGIWTIVGYVQQSVGPSVTQSDLRVGLPRELPPN